MTERIYHYEQDENTKNFGGINPFYGLEDFTNIPEVLFNSDKRRENEGKIQYYIKWRSQGYDQSTWEFEEDIPSTTAIQQYEERHKFISEDEGNVGIKRQK